MDGYKMTCEMLNLIINNLLLNDKLYLFTFLEANFNHWPFNREKIWPKNAFNFFQSTT